MTDTADTLSRIRRRNAHADIDRASPEDLASVAHNLVDDLADIIEAIARQAADQTRHYINRPRPSTSPPPSQETGAELPQERAPVKEATTKNDTDLLTLPEVAQVLRVRVAQVLRLEHNKELRVVRLSRRVARVRRSDLDTFMSKQGIQ